MTPTVEDLVKQRDEIISELEDQVSEIVEDLEKIEGKYGSFEHETNEGKWKLSYGDGEIHYLRLEKEKDKHIYVISDDPAPVGVFLESVEDFENFTKGFKKYVAELADKSETIVEKIDAIKVKTSAEEIEVSKKTIEKKVGVDAEKLVLEIHQITEKESGVLRVDTGRNLWELNFKEEGVRYLRVGGEEGTYLVSQYETAPPRKMIGAMADYQDFVDYVEKYLESKKDSEVERPENVEIV